MKRITIILSLLFLSSLCFAAGWHDYSLDIGDGYRVFRANSLDVSISRADGRVILHPSEYENVGPVMGYISTADVILTMNWGRKSRNLFEGDTFEEVDTSREYFFVIDKANDEVRGPFSADEFYQQPEVEPLAGLDWQIPKSPNVAKPLLGNFYFIAFSIPILAIKFFWITIPMIIAISLLMRYFRNKRQARTQRLVDSNALPPTEES